ncbi:MAG: hypothetical protein LBD40_02085 [Puniceicoccales bacterium]|nr:hypothetical protein [Puniceicoccales bacterium]
MDGDSIDDEVQSVFWETRQQGLIVLKTDWKVHETGMPPFRLILNEENIPFHLERLSPFEYAKRSGYYRDQQYLHFILLPEWIPKEDAGCSSFFLAGDFNAWQPESENTRWQLHPEIVHGELCWILRILIGKIKDDQNFKYVSSQKHWAQIAPHSLNVVEATPGIFNFVYSEQRTGYHLFRFFIDAPFSLQNSVFLQWYPQKNLRAIDDSRVLLKMRSEQPMGVSFVGRQTYFRLFGPRLHSVELHLRDPRSELEVIQPLSLDEDGVWSCFLDIPVNGFFYHYRIQKYASHTGQQGIYEESILTDPYAKALCGPKGPGIIVPQERLDPSHCDEFQVPDWEDLQIMEVHLRDLLAHADNIPEEKRYLFSGLREWLDDPHNYLLESGINAVELQPIAEYEHGEAHEYAWGYMPTNFFAPCSAYASNPQKTSQVTEFQELVAKFHSLGIAVILDVVYNHLGSPNPYVSIDSDYYFRHNSDGHLSNFSGCGNDFRSEAPMAQRAILDNLEHWIKTYHVDGFRFDLAELLGMDCLRAIEEHLKKIKPSVILIAEPWSFRGYIGHEIRSTGFAAWNDEYRNFIADYVRGNGNREGLEYFMGGSLKYRSKFPAQSINYATSHDDRCWIDHITENAHHNGYHPTEIDRRRTHLSIAMLFASIGIPMFTAGQDFFHSKHGTCNTYKNPELNALDYKRGLWFASTREYFQKWSHYRKSPSGRLWRLPKRPSRHYLRAYPSREENSSMALFFNASEELGSQKLLFVINPHATEVHFDLSELSSLNLRQIADTERLDAMGLQHSLYTFQNSVLQLPPLSCGLWESF